MSKLISYGDRLKAGKYQVHSRFAKVVNLISEDSLIALVAQEIGEGPLNIVFDGLNLEDVKTLSIGQVYFMLNENKFPFKPDRCYQSGIEIDGAIDHCAFQTNLDCFGECLIEMSPPKSLAVLLDNKREAEFVSSFDKNMLDQFNQGVKRLFNGDCLEGVSMLSGLGYGLTPSGDDFIAGVLTALNMIQLINKNDLLLKIEQIYEAAEGSNAIANAMLWCAKNGCLNHTQKQLVHAIHYGDRPHIQERVFGLMQIGETSGADWGVGLYMTLKNAA
jgi:hypothetical protein